MAIIVDLLSVMNKDMKRKKNNGDMVTEHNIRLLKLFFFFSFGQVYTLMHSITGTFILLLIAFIQLSIKAETEYKHLGR